MPQFYFSMYEYAASLLWSPYLIHFFWNCRILNFWNSCDPWSLFMWWNLGYQCAGTDARHRTSLRCPEQASWSGLRRHRPGLAAGLMTSVDQLALLFEKPTGRVFSLVQSQLQLQALWDMCKTSHVDNFFSCCMCVLRCMEEIQSLFYWC